MFPARAKKGWMWMFIGFSNLLNHKAFSFWATSKRKLNFFLNFFFFSSPLQYPLIFFFYPPRNKYNKKIHWKMVLNISFWRACNVHAVYHWFNFILVSKLSLIRLIINLFIILNEWLKLKHLNLKVNNNPIIYAAAT